VLDCNYYWPSQRRELRAIRSRLRPGGVLVMRVADTSWAIRMALEIGRVFPTAGRKLFERAVYDHRVSIPIQSLLQLVREEGFTTIYTSVMDAVPVRHHNLKALAAYAIGNVSWRLAGINLAPGMVFMARKERP
jgi:spermidine synthase